MDITALIVAFMATMLSFMPSINRRVSRLLMRRTFSEEAKRLITIISTKTNRKESVTIQNSSELKTMYNLCIDYYLKTSETKSVAMIYSVMVGDSKRNTELLPTVTLLQNGEDGIRDIDAYSHDGSMSALIKKVMAYEEKVCFHENFHHIYINNTKKNKTKLHFDVDLSEHEIRSFICVPNIKKNSCVTFYGPEVIPAHINYSAILKMCKSIATYMNAAYEEVSKQDRKFCYRIDEHKSRWFCYTPTVQALYGEKDVYFMSPNPVCLSNTISSKTNLAFLLTEQQKELIDELYTELQLCGKDKSNKYKILWGFQTLEHSTNIEIYQSIINIWFMNEFEIDLRKIGLIK